ncbi:MAG TPA: outer membrane lipoprotein LolB [Burkholderiaceae bacterium]|nr:outer membrane lipoprotein LolB [Burkholderiaceae bacterium]
MSGCRAGSRGLRQAVATGPCSRLFPAGGSSLLAAVLCVTLAAGCASLPPATATGGVNYSGRFALVVDGVDRHETMSGRFALTVDKSEVTLDLSTPLGTTVARVQSGPAGARVTVPTAGGLRSQQGPDPDALSLQVLGWTLPVSGIGDWIEGRPASGRPYRLDPGQGGAALLEQDGWTIRFDPRGADGRLRRLDMSRPRQGDAPAVSLRVVLDAGAGS